MPGLSIILGAIQSWVAIALHGFLDSARSPLKIIGLTPKKYFSKSHKKKLKMEEPVLSVPALL